MTSPFHGIFSALNEGMSDSDDEQESPLRRDVPIASPKSASTVGRLAVDIYEQDGYYIVRVPIAGVRMSDMDIEVNDNVLTIRGIRKQSDNVPESQYYIRECHWGAFSRSITLPNTIDPRKVRATFSKDSILKVLIPKEEKVKIIRITEGN